MNPLGSTIFLPRSEAKILSDLAGGKHQLLMALLRAMKCRGWRSNSIVFPTFPV